MGMSSVFLLNRAAHRTTILISSCKISYLLVPPSSYQSKLLPSSLIPSRTFWETFPHTSRSLHRKDKLNREKFHLIYRARLFNYAFYGQFFSMNIFAMQLIFGLYYIYKSYILKEALNLITEFGPYHVNYNLTSLVVLSIVTIQNALVYRVAQTAVLRIYHRKDTDDYVFVLLDNNPFQSKFLVCKNGDLERIHTNTVLEVLGNCKLRGRKVFIKETNFDTMWHYNRMLGIIK